MKSLVDEKGSCLAQCRIKLQIGDNEVVLEKSVGWSLPEKEKETNTGFIYLLVLFITFANLLGDEQLYHRVKVNNILRGFTSLFSARDFLFSFVQLTSLTFPDVFLELSNWQGLI
jgi:hypothetical protein